MLFCSKSTVQWLYALCGEEIPSFFMYEKHSGTSFSKIVGEVRVNKLVYINNSVTSWGRKSG